jgi:hypothetical protein
VPAESERVGEREPYRSLEHPAVRVLEVAVGIGAREVDRRRDLAVRQTWIETIASSAPAAPSRWPVIDLVEPTTIS